jgi:hypothetical protein
VKYGSTERQSPPVQPVGDQLLGDHGEVVESRGRIRFCPKTDTALAGDIVASVDHESQLAIDEYSDPAAFVADLEDVPVDPTRVLEAQ